MVAIVQGKSGPALSWMTGTWPDYLQELVSFFDICHLLTAHGFNAYCI